MKTVKKIKQYKKNKSLIFVELNGHRKCAWQLRDIESFLFSLSHDQ